MSSSIPPKFLKENIYVCSQPLTIIINNGILNSSFDGGLKLADLIPMYKVLNGIGPVFMNDIFVRNGSMGTENVSSNTRSKSKFYNQSNPKKVRYGLETLRCLGPKIWEMLPCHIKNSVSLSAFKNRIKSWTPHSCPCRICKVFIPQLVFL